MQAVLLHNLPDEVAKTLQNLLAAYFHTIPLSELIGSRNRSKRQEQLIYVTISGAACSFCLSENGRFERVRAGKASFADRGTVAHLLFSQLIAIPTEDRFYVRLSSEAKGRQFRSVREILQQAMCVHDAQKITLAVRELDTQA